MERTGYVVVWEVKGQAGGPGVTEVKKKQH